MTDDAAGERVVEAAAQLPVEALRGIDVADLTYMLDDLRLASRGANIGRTLVTVYDSVTRDPLYASANDVLWGQRGTWYSPLVSGFAAGARGALRVPKTSGVEPDGAPQPPETPTP